MFTALINGNASLTCSFTLKGGKLKASINGKSYKGDLLRISSYEYHLILGQQSLSIELLRLNPEDKTLQLRINAKRVQVKLRDKYDELLHSLGLDEINQKKANDIKAPMPGMVLNVLVKDGDTVKKGDAILVLEAMKMENILKSPSDGIIKKVAISKGTAVEKNQLLVQF
ncbi:MAG TPA: acetyl-CoA carboxylase biotin carboxyl carrier protein subunit [Bacteroidia bacterium]|nr:acetyl-CoA carboxylase biotin carboxyl carrier protein subunit [Bacteroidia bacterium]